MSRKIKLIYGIAGSVGSAISAVKIALDAGRAVNGWHILFAISIITMCAVGLECYRESVDSRFEELEKKIAERMEREEMSRTLSSSTTQLHLSILDSRLQEQARRLTLPPQ